MPSSQGPSLGQKAFSAVAWLSALNGLGGLGMIALAWWLNRALPDAPVRMGQWSVVLSLLLMTSLIFEGGISSVIQQRKELDHDALAALSWMQLALGLLGGAALFGLAHPLARLMSSDEHAAETASLIRLATIAVAIIAAGLPPKALLQRDLRFKIVASVEGGATIVTIALAIVLVPRVGIRGLVLATIARHAVETALYWSLGEARPWTALRAPSWSRVRAPFRAGASMGAQGLLGTLVRQGDVLLIGALTGTVGAGLYRQIQQLVVQPYAKLTTFVARAAFPALAKVQDDPPRLLRGVTRMQRLLALAVLPLQLGLAAIAPRLLAELLGDQYQEHLRVAVPAMMLLCLAAAFSACSTPLIVALNASNHGDAVLGRQAAGSLLMLALMAAGAAFGLPGIAAGRVAAAALSFLMLLALADAAFGFGRAATFGSLREALPASLACFAAASLAGLALTRAWPQSAPFQDASAARWALIAQVVAGGAAYGAALLALRVDPRREWRSLRA